MCATKWCDGEYTIWIRVGGYASMLHDLHQPASIFLAFTKRSWMSMSISVVVLYL